MHMAFLAILLEEEEMAAVMASERGSKAGKRNLPRVRKSLNAMMTELGTYVRRAYRMTLQAFLELHDIIAPAFLAKLRSGSSDSDPTGPNGGFICTKLCLSAAIQFLAGVEVWGRGGTSCHPIASVGHLEEGVNVGLVEREGRGQYTF